MIKIQPFLMDYFIHFLNKEDLKCTITKDVSQLDYDQDTTIHNGLYYFSFRDQGQMKVVKARYTFVINQNQILTHHSSLLPE